MTSRLYERILNTEIDEYLSYKKCDNTGGIFRQGPMPNKLFIKNLYISDATNRVVILKLRHTFTSHLAIKDTPILTIKNS